MKRTLWIILGIIVLCAAVAAVVFRNSLLAFVRPSIDETATGGEGDDMDLDGASPNAAGAVWALGRLEPAGGVINISATPGDQLLELFVKEGEQVDPQKILARLQSNELRETEVDQLETQKTEANDKLEAERQAAQNKLEAAKLAEEQAKSVAQQEIQAQTAKAEALRLAVTQAQKEVERLTNLRSAAPDLVSEQQLEQSQLAQQRAEAELEAARVAIHSAQVAADYQIRLATQQREAAELALGQIDKTAPIASLQKQFEAAQQRAARAKLRSPVRGTVLKVFTEPGETISQRPILQIANLDEMVCIAEVSHEQVRQITPGIEARIHSRAFAGAANEEVLTGTVISKSLVAATPELREIDPFAAADRHVMEVRIELDEESSRIASRFVHLQVEVEFVFGDDSEP